MAKVTLPSVGTQYLSTEAVNANFQILAAELNTKVLYRDNPIDEPNQLENDVDMNSHRILNLPEPVNSSEAARLQDVQNAIAGGAANLIPFTPAGSIAATNVQSAIEEVAADAAASLASHVAAVADAHLSTAVNHTPNYSGGVATTTAKKLDQTVSVFDFMTAAEIADVQAGTALVDVTNSFQKALNATGLTSAEYFATTDDYRRAKKKLYVPAGTYLIGNLRCYQGSTVEFDPRALLKIKPGVSYGLATVNYQGQSNPNFAVERVTLIRPRIDMDGNGTFGLLLQCLTNSSVYLPEVLNVPAGTANYDDGSGLGSTAYDKTGIILKGIHGVAGTYWNEIYMPRVKGVSGGGNNGIWLGTSSTGSEQRANHNRIIAPYTETLARGVQIMGGGDNYIELPETSLCDIGIAIGLTSGTVPCKRNHIKQPYLESCSVSGIRLTNNAYDTIIDGIGSTSGTATPIDDSGILTSFFSANSDTYTAGFVRPYKGSLRFPATQVSDSNVNALDDYKEADFTPAIAGTTSAGTGTYTTQVGKVTKIGRQVHIDINLNWTAHTGTGDLKITGLPYTALSTSPLAVYIQSGLPLAGGPVMQARTVNGSTEITLTQYNGTSVTAIPMDTAAVIQISGTYIAAT